MPHESSNYVVINAPLTTLTVADDIEIIKIPAQATIMSLSGSLRTLVSGTQTITLKNDGGSTLGTVTWLAAGNTAGTINSSSVSANDSIHLNITSLGVSVVDCTVTMWLKLQSIP